MAQRSTIYRKRTQAQADGLYLRRDTAKQTFGYGNWFVAWSLMHVAYAIFMSSVFFDRNFSGYGWAATPIMTLSCLTQVGLANVRFRLPTKLPWTVFELFLFFGYAMICGLLANADFGRNVQLTLGWHTVCLVFYGAISLSVIQATYISEKNRDIVKWMILASLVASGLVGLIQNFNIANARDMFPGLEKQPPGIYRPTGLTNYPSQLGFQGLLGMAMVGVPLIFRNLKWWEWMGLGFFALVILSAQYRSMYYAGIGLCMVAFYFMIWRRDRAQAAVYAIVALCLLAVPLIAFPNRFVYGMRGAKDDPALLARQQAWQMAEPAIMMRPLTGIGPDGNLLVGHGMSVTPDKFSTEVLDNLYIAVRACYGWIGVALASIFVITTFCGLLLRSILGSAEASSWAVASILISVSILFFSLTGNSVIYTTVGCLSAIIFSLTAPTWREETQQSMMTDQFVRFRSAVSSGLRKIGINIG